MATRTDTVRVNAPATSLSKEEILRYSRHLIMPEVGMEGQLKLKNAKVLLIGTGGLGAPLGLYLAAAGVGKLGLVDFDVVDFTNLQRQVTFGTSDVGKHKSEAARARLANLNPDIEVLSFETQLTSANALELFKDFDIIVDGTDNFRLCYLVNDACILLEQAQCLRLDFPLEGKPRCSVCRMALATAACIRSRLPGLVPSSLKAAYLMLPGIVGSIQAMETIKLILGTGDSLAGRLLLFDALGMKFRELKLRKNPDCPMCGKDRTIHELIDYYEFCGVRGEEAPAPDLQVPEITPRELKARLDGGDDLYVLDVREPHEYQICNIKGTLCRRANCRGVCMN
jgi:adenylyltransferase/sulfurtransferase